MRTRLLQDLQKKTIRFKSIVALTCLLLTSVSAFAQTKTVTGTVTDAANEPLIGASVLVQGTSTGTITDMDGKYSISVTPEDVLVFSYVGMTTQSVKVGAQNVINVTRTCRCRSRNPYPWYKLHQWLQTIVRGRRTIQ